MILFLKKINLYLNTLKYLQLSQIIYRFKFIFPVFKKKITRLSIPKRRPELNLTTYFLRYPRAIFSRKKFIFLNLESNEDISNLWNHEKKSKLWLFNLHYLRDLSNITDNSQQELMETIFQNWIEKNPIGFGVGWSSPTLSLRIVNLIKWFLEKKIENSFFIKSLVHQIRYLEKKIEYHLKGNHLLSNAKALIFAGFYFQGNEAEIWLKKGMKILEKEIPEQILSDGGHFERSTMYHSIILEDLLDLENLFISNPYILSSKYSNIEELRKTIDKMILWLQAMIHPDNEISFFNDAAFKVSASPKNLFDFAKRLNHQLPALENGLTYLKDSGYIRYESNDLVLIIDVAEVCPSYLPAHAHADTLSYEFSYKNQRVIVNSGTSQYDRSDQRNFERGTSAHSTLEIDGRNSSEIWGIFRVAKRAKVSDICFEEKNEKLIISAKHDGFSLSKNKIFHKRKWVIEKNGFKVKDKIIGSFSKAISYTFLHPSIKVDEKYLYLDDSIKISWNSKPRPSRIESSLWHKEFGASKRNINIQLDLNFKKNIIKSNIKFKIN